MEKAAYAKLLFPVLFMTEIHNNHQRWVTFWVLIRYWVALKAGGWLGILGLPGMEWGVSRTVLGFTNFSKRVSQASRNSPVPSVKHIKVHLIFVTFAKVKWKKNIINNSVISLIKNTETLVHGFSLYSLSYTTRTTGHFHFVIITYSSLFCALSCPPYLYTIQGTIQKQLSVTFTCAHK